MRAPPLDSSRTLRQRCAEAQTAPGGRLHQSSHPFPHHTGHCSLINPVECPIVVDRFRFGTVFYLSSSPLLWSIAGGFLVASAVVPRFYCRYACPLGAALGVASFFSIFRIRRVEQCAPCKVCEHACPTGAIRGPEIDFKECVRCNICETKLLTKAGVWQTYTVVAFRGARFCGLPQPWACRQSSADA